MQSPGLAAASDDPRRVTAVYAQGGLVSYASILEAPFVQVPHAVIVPDWLSQGDLDDLLAEVAPLPVRLEGLVDGRNRLCPDGRLAGEYPRAREAYAKTKPNLVTRSERTSPAAWLLEQLR